MALRKYGKIYHILYRDINGKVCTKTTGETNKREAQVKERAWMAQLTAERKRHKHGIKVLAPTSNVAAGFDFSVSDFDKTKKRRRLKLANVLETIARYKEVSYNSQKIWNRFMRRIGVEYMDQISPDMAFGYLNKYYGEQSGKAFNNNRTALNAIFKKLRLDAGMDESPFDRVPFRQHKGKRQRAFSEAEFLRIFKAAHEPWKTAALISWHTGLRENDALAIGPDNIEDNIIRTLPGKTSRFERRVRIPVHPQLAAWLKNLPPSNDDRFVGFIPDRRGNNKFTREFSEILAKLDIKDNEKGIVKFNSLRNSFITRMKDNGVPSEVIRGMVGHMNDDQTEWYSESVEPAKVILDFKAPKINIK